MKLACPSCTANLNAPDRLIGKEVECPRCGEPVLVVDPNSVEELEEFLDEEESPSATKPRGAMLTCPMCGAKNQPSAVTCPSCGENAAAGAEVWRDGKKLIMRKTAELPYRCLKTNQPADGWLRRKLFWHHPAVYFALMANLIIYAILAVCLQKKADIRVPLCQARLNRRRWMILFTWLCALGGIAAFVVGLMSLDRPDKNLAPLLIFGGLFGGLFGTIIGLILMTVVSPAKITDDYVWLKGVHPAYLDELPDWPGDHAMGVNRKQKR
jgi:DNA-directed RNA polymerase subunit M/transcription elongation factor TFIIS